MALVCKGGGIVPGREVWVSPTCRNTADESRVQSVRNWTFDALRAPDGACRFDVACHLRVQGEFVGQLDRQAVTKQLKVLRGAAGVVSTFSAAVRPATTYLSLAVDICEPNVVPVVRLHNIVRGVFAIAAPHYALAAQAGVLAYTLIKAAVENGNITVHPTGPLNEGMPA